MVTNTLFINPGDRSNGNIYLTPMKFSPGQEVIVLDTTHKPAGSAIVQVYQPEAHSCIVLFQYPGSPAPECIPVPEYRLVSLPFPGAPAFAPGNS